MSFFDKIRGKNQGVQVPQQMPMQYSQQHPQPVYPVQQQQQPVPVPRPIATPINEETAFTGVTQKSVVQSTPVQQREESYEEYDEGGEVEQAVQEKRISDERETVTGPIPNEEEALERRLQEIREQRRIQEEEEQRKLEEFTRERSRVISNTKGQIQEPQYIPILMNESEYLREILTRIDRIEKLLMGR